MCVSTQYMTLILVLFVFQQCFTHYGPLHQNGRYAYEMKCMTARVRSFELANDPLCTNGFFLFA